MTGVRATNKVAEALSHDTKINLCHLGGGGCGGGIPRGGAEYHSRPRG